MTNDKDIWQGTLALMILRTLELMGPLHGYGIARRIEQISQGQLIVLYGTIYPALLRLEQDGYIAGYIPAVRAARKDPLRALRLE